jgi:hypothetical protein
VDTTTFKPDQYIVKVSGIIQHVTGSTYFNILNGPRPTPVTTVQTLPPTIVVPVTSLAPPTATTTPKSPLPIWTAVSVLIALVYLKKRSY